ncbi:hypothetical protein [Mycobacterium sp.]|uniref:hypothetical protein n=1 Tax=Mycobacterium sp. TaxID=1785 RepID=UPI0025E695E6|nr:hypothetical protein [Mycobacterium sp.]
MDATPTGSSDTPLQRAAALAAHAARRAAPARIQPPTVPNGRSPLDAALGGALAAINNTVTSAEAADIAAADQQQAVLADLARREQEDHL